ncbi:TPA: prolipoprotein diacylglyceryl transferase, partial [Enterococcus faecium]|nr:prolipoprotein diacylglyceryl transferase [Enterococcus faecium]
YFLGVIRISQLLSAVLFVGTLILFIWRRKKGSLPDYDRSLGKNQQII